MEDQLGPRPEINYKHINNGWSTSYYATKPASKAEPISGLRCAHHWCRSGVWLPKSSQGTSWLTTDTEWNVLPTSDAPIRVESKSSRGGFRRRRHMVLVCKIRRLRGTWLTQAGIAILAHGLTLSPTPTSSHSTSRCLMNGTGASTLLAKKRRYATANSLRRSTSSMRTCNSTLEFAPHIGVRSAIPGFSQTKGAKLTPHDSS